MFIISKRAPKAQTLHDNVVRALANKLKTDGYTVYADIPEFTQPPKVGDYVPDVYAVNASSKIIGEAETCDTIGSDHTKEQYTVFSNIQDVLFHVIVPESCLTEAQTYAALWGITVDKWWQYEGYQKHQ